MRNDAVCYVRVAFCINNIIYIAYAVFFNLNNFFTVENFSDFKMLGKLPHIINEESVVMSYNNARAIFECYPKSICLLSNNVIKFLKAVWCFD